MAWLSLPLTLVALAVAPALWFIAKRSRTKLHPATWYAQSQAAAVAGVVDGAVTGVRVVKGFGQEEQETGKLREVGRRLFAGRLRTIRLNSRYTPALQAVPALGQVAMLALGGWLATRGQITLGTFVAFSTYLAQLVGPVRMLAMVLTVGQQARAGVGARPGADRHRARRSTDGHARRSPPTRPPPSSSTTCPSATTTSGPVLDGLLASRSGPARPSPSSAPPAAASPPSRSCCRASTTSTRGAVLVGGHDVRELTYDVAARRDRPRPRGLLPLLRHRPRQHRVRHARTRPTSRSRPPPAPPRPTASSPSCPTATTPRSASTASPSPAASASASPSPARSSPTPGCWSSTTPPPPWTPASSTRSTRPCAPSWPGRTTLLIAHRRSTLGLADRIAVLDGGRLADIGTHEELERRSALYRRLLTDPDELGGVSPRPRSRAGRLEREPTGPTGQRLDAGTSWTPSSTPSAASRPGPVERGDRERPTEHPAASPARPPPPNCSPRSTRCRPADDTPDVDEARAVAPPRSATACAGCCAASGAAAAQPRPRRRRRGHGPAAAGPDPARHRRGRGSRPRSARSGRPPASRLVVGASCSGPRRSARPG